MAEQAEDHAVAVNIEPATQAQIASEKEFEDEQCEKEFYEQDSEDENSEDENFDSTPDFNVPELTAESLLKCVLSNTTINDENWKDDLQKHLLNDANAKTSSNPAGEPLWKTTDYQGNSILHVAAISERPESVAWIMEKYPNLLTTINEKEMTALQALHDVLEQKRTTRMIHCREEKVSDEFKGYSRAAVSVLMKLQSMRNLTVTEQLRITYGCTCGKCCQGFLSPRMRHSLLYVAQDISGKMEKWIHDLDGPSFVENLSDDLKFFSSDMLEALKDQHSLRRGLTRTYSHFEGRLKGEHSLPSDSSIQSEIKRCVDKQHGEPCDAKEFLGNIGSVYCIGVRVFARAKQEHADGYKSEDMENFRNQISKLSECRNDREFGFVKAMCGYEEDMQKSI
jgi:hypothetical protein